MPASKAHMKATNKWMAKAYDRVNLTMPKGKKEIVQAHAEDIGTSVNGFINRAIDEAMARDKRPLTRRWDILQKRRCET